MNKAFGDLITNLCGGLKLCRLKTLEPEDFRISADQLVLLILLSITFSIASGYLNHLPAPDFNVYAITTEGFSVAVLLLSAYVIARFILKRQVTIALCILFLSVSVIFAGIWQLVELVIIDNISNTSTYWLMWGAYMLWFFVAIFWCIRTINGSITFRVPLSFITILFTWVMPIWYFAADVSYWYSSDTEPDDDSYAAYRDLNAERMLFSQYTLLNQELEALRPERPGIVDIYFVGVGAYARQDVFLKETVFAKNLFDSRFDTQGRSINLINHLSTHTNLPLATSTNLEETLRYIGSTMNKEEDILFLYMTSHGSRDHEFSMSFWPLPLNDVTPAMLRNYLDESGIKWRVVMISSCYSGGFVEPLKNDYSAIATAAAPDRKSFGCSNENDFTYFGEALLKNQLQDEYSIPIAFSQAAHEIAARESKENLTASNPQFIVGNSIAPILDLLSNDLQEHAQASLPCMDNANTGQQYLVAGARNIEMPNTRASDCH
jgi:hypothetical protein